MDDSSSVSQLARGGGEKPALGEREIALDRHEAAVRREQKPLGLDVVERAARQRDDFLQRLGRRIARIDAAEDDGAIPADREHRRIVAAAREFEREAADPALHEQFEQLGIFVFVLALAAAGASICPSSQPAASSASSSSLIADATSSASFSSSW